MSERLSISTIADTVLIEKDASNQRIKEVFLSRHWALAPDMRCGWKSTSRNGRWVDLSEQLTSSGKLNRMSYKAMGSLVDFSLSDAAVTPEFRFSGSVDVSRIDFDATYRRIVAKEMRVKRYKDRSETVGDTGNSIPMQELTPEARAFAVDATQQGLDMLGSIGTPIVSKNGYGWDTLKLKLIVPEDVSSTCSGGEADAVVMGRQLGMPVVVDIKNTKDMVGQGNPLGSKPKYQAQLLAYFLLVLAGKRGRNWSEIDYRPDLLPFAIAVVNPRLGQLESITVDRIAIHPEWVRSIATDLLGLDEGHIEFLMRRLDIAVSIAREKIASI